MDDFTLVLKEPILDDFLKTLGLTASIAYGKIIIETGISSLFAIDESKYLDKLAGEYDNFLNYGFPGMVTSLFNIIIEPRYHGNQGILLKGRKRSYDSDIFQIKAGPTEFKETAKMIKDRLIKIVYDFRKKEKRNPMEGLGERFSEYLLPYIENPTKLYRDIANEFYTNELIILYTKNPSAVHHLNEYARKRYIKVNGIDGKKAIMYSEGLCEFRKYLYEKQWEILGASISETELRDFVINYSDGVVKFPEAVLETIKERFLEELMNSLEDAKAYGVLELIKISEVIKIFSDKGFLGFLQNMLDENPSKFILTYKHILKNPDFEKEVDALVYPNKEISDLADLTGDLSSLGIM